MVILFPTSHRSHVRRQYQPQPHYPSPVDTTIQSYSTNMRSTTIVALLASAAAAQESATVLALMPYGTALTYVTSDVGATTYTNSCPTGAIGIPTQIESGSYMSCPLFLNIPIDTSIANKNSLEGFSQATETADTTPTPSPTGMQRMRLRRQDQSSQTTDLESPYCEPYTIVQGPETYAVHLTDPVAGVLTADLACNWQGVMTAAQVTCTLTQSGSFFESTAQGTQTSTASGEEIVSLGVYVTVAVPTGSASVTSGTTGAPAASRSGSAAAQSSRSATASTGLAAAGPLPTGVVALMGGAAAGVIAAALAL
jgi:hypothetical protein